MRQLPTDNSGFTIVEIVVSITIAIIIFLLITSTYVISQNAYSQTDVTAELTQNGRVMLDRLVREIRQAQRLSNVLPTDTSDPEALPNEIKFLDGHDISYKHYIRYYQEDNTLKRQVIVYYFPASTTYYVLDTDTDVDEPHNPPLATTTEDKIIGEFVDDVEFWGNKLININLYLSKDNTSQVIYTAVFGRNL
ncbi:MAG: hypothetical protein WC473_04955 [Patescibacteria group bacterium]|jgi:type II secretory pathway pseudopilin PulG